MSRLKRRIFLSPPHLNGRELDMLREALESNWVAPAGPHLAAFERELCAVIGGGYGVALSSGTAALHLALRALGVQAGDRVFCSDLTFSGSVNPVLYERAEPVLIDSAPGGCNMDPKALARALHQAEKEDRLPKAAVIVDLYGQSADWRKLLPLCEAYGVPVLEDAAEALGASCADVSCGLFGAIGVFSFNGNKIITTSGGGMAVAHDEATAHRLTFWANQSKEAAPYYLHRELGFNYRLSNLLAGVGRAQLQTLKERVARRKEIYLTYQNAFAGLPLQMLPVPQGCTPNYWLSVALLEEDAPLSAQALIDLLEADNIEARRTWNPMHCQPVFRRFTYVTAADGISGSEDFFRRGICLPSGSGMTAEEQDEVIRRVCRALGGGAACG
ncbi:MAG: DegT/DnrJ/EryC1/StrS family aminotransferase [Oscillospiraceae bacterium]|nr:DegT/DnrJ/EryC1/StrS family aminotransferase [Oscillospiraceae bacterium]